jgi:hypothetical protein
LVFSSPILANSISSNGEIPVVRREIPVVKVYYRNVVPVVVDNFGGIFQRKRTATTFGLLRETAFAQSTHPLPLFLGACRRFSRLMRNRQQSFLGTAMRSGSHCPYTGSVRVVHGE